MGLLGLCVGVIAGDWNPTTLLWTLLDVISTAMKLLSSFIRTCVLQVVVLSMPSLLGTISFVNKAAIALG